MQSKSREGKMMTAAQKNEEEEEKEVKKKRFKTKQPLSSVCCQTDDSFFFSTTVSRSMWEPGEKNVVAREGGDGGPMRALHLYIYWCSQQLHTCYACSEYMCVVAHTKTGKKKMCVWKRKKHKWLVNIHVSQCLIEHLSFSRSFFLQFVWTVFVSVRRWLFTNLRLLHFWKALVSETVDLMNELWIAQPGTHFMFPPAPSIPNHTQCDTRSLWVLLFPSNGSGWWESIWTLWECFRHHFHYR